jgi:6-phosphogluconate dehydrogenase
MNQPMDIGVIGLSVMGQNLVLNLADNGYRVAGFNRSGAVTKKFMAASPHPNVTAVYTLEELVASLAPPRRILMMIKAGAPVDAVIDALAPLLTPGDVLMDGGNTYFKDTIRREAALAARGIRYLGIGISGGETGARRGPSIMPGGDADAYAAVRAILEKIAAKAENEPCCTYIGPGGAGHFVKMVHNGIEYADMQLIAEAYLLLKYQGGYSNAELADIFEAWNQGELKSYLIGITAEIFREADDLAPGELIDAIRDAAAQKGTGKWAGIEALENGDDLSLITAAVNARLNSGETAQRDAARRLIDGPALQQGRAIIHDDGFVEMVRKALYTGKITAYAQGFAMLKHASRHYGWKLKLGEIAAIFRAGCIIQAQFLDDITKAYRDEPDMDNLLFGAFFRRHVNAGQESLRAAAMQGILGGLPVPALTGAVAYLDSLRAGANGANLIQAQRDYFGAHTYMRTDREGSFHHPWGNRYGH